MDEGCAASSCGGITPELEHDWLLDRWVRLAELGVEVGITLQLGGLLVAGTLVGARAYLEHQSAVVVPSLAEQGLPLSITRRLTQAFQSDLEALEEADRMEREGVDCSRQFIHLKDARLSASTDFQQAFAVPFWRGRLSAVDSFFLGTVRRVADGS